MAGDRYTSRIADHDLEVKTNKVLEFLSKGYFVKISVGVQVSWGGASPGPFFPDYARGARWLR